MLERRKPADTRRGSLIARPISKLLRVAVRLLGPLLLVVVVWRLENKGGLVDVVGDAAVVPLAIVVLINGPIVHLKVVRWRALLKARGYVGLVALVVADQ